MHLLTKQLLVSSNFKCWPTVINRNLHPGDIAVSEKTVHKLMKPSSGSNAAIWKAYPDSQVDLWDQNLVNGEYVIAFEMNPGLGQSLQNLLPAVSTMAQNGGSRNEKATLLLMPLSNRDQIEIRVGSFPKSGLAWV